jgi:hypothetical protein
LLIALALPPVVHAHSTSTAYLEVDATAANTPALQWRIALRDVDALLDLDANGDDQLTWGEVTDRSADIVALAASKIAVKSGSAACTLRFDPPTYVRLADAGYAHLSAGATCSAAVSAIDYRLFEGVDPSHRVLVSVRGGSQPRIVSAGVTIDVSTSADRARSGFGGFFSSGIAHIAGGIDHVLFLLTLLLPAVLLRQHSAKPGRWVAREDVQGALWTVVWIATAFTVAHSITLALATFDVVRIPARVIEPLIALTIVATALNNVWPVVTRNLAAVAFAFGLIHGFGFAEVLMPLSLPRSELAVALLGFNLGVEAGQLAIVAVAFLVLAALRRWRGYPRWVLTLGSALIAVVALLWFIERVFDVSIFASSTLQTPTAMQAL